MTLTDLLSPHVIRIPLESVEKNQIIEEMVDILYQTGRIEHRDKVLRAVQERESMMSTGMGDGVAIPHAKTDGVKELIASFGVTKHGIDFQSIDGKPVRIIFLLVGPTKQTGPHLKALSRISRLVHQKAFRDALINASNPDDIINAIQNEEKKYFSI